MNALAIRNLTITYGAHPVLDGLALDVPAGSFTSLVGPSGCGKTTLLRTVAGLLSPADGEMLIFGRRANGCACAAGVGFLFQEDALLPWRTTRDNVALGLRFCGVAAAPARAEANRWLERVGLGGFGHYYPHELSGGMKKRAALAQVLAPRPRLLLMDEPFASLDAIARTVLETDFQTLVRDEGLTVVLVTHDLEEALLLSDQIALMSAAPAAAIRRVYPVPFPHPRDLMALRVTAGFGALFQTIWEDLRREAGRMGWEVPA